MNQREVLRFSSALVLIDLRVALNVLHATLNAYFYLKERFNMQHNLLGLFQINFSSTRLKFKTIQMDYVVDHGSFDDLNM